MIWILNVWCMCTVTGKMQQCAVTTLLVSNEVQTKIRLFLSWFRPFLTKDGKCLINLLSVVWSGLRVNLSWWSTRGWQSWILNFNIYDHKPPESWRVMNHVNCDVERTAANQKASCLRNKEAGVKTSMSCLQGFLQDFFNLFLFIIISGFFRFKRSQDHHHSFFLHALFLCCVLCFLVVVFFFLC